MRVDGLLLRLGVDPIQWRALLRVSLRIDFPIVPAKKTKVERSYASMLRMVLLVYGLAGLTPAVVIFRSHDVLLGSTSLATIVALMVATTLLSGEGSAIVSPSDHQILGFRPVTSRTYLAVRVGALLVRSFVVSACVAFLPILVLLLKANFRPWLAIAALLTAEACGIAVTLGIVAMYGWVLRVAGPQRTLRYTAYVQLVANSVTWIGFIAVSQGINTRAFEGAALSTTKWWLAIPSAWFGTYGMMAAGQFHWTAFVGAALSLGTIGLFGWLIRDKLSMSYAENLARLATVTTKAGPKAREWMRGLNAETRAVAILVRSQLEHDMKFRLGLISLVPITVFYMFMGGWPRDPFMRGLLPRGGGSDGPFIQLALVFLPMSLRQVIVSSESYRASWIFHTTPADRGKLVLSSRNVITAFFLIPYLAFLAVVFAYSYGNATHALIHAAFLGLVSWLVLQMMIMLSPQLPFSMAHGKDTNAGMAFVRLFASMGIGMASYFILILLVYKTPLRMVIAAAVLISLGLVMDRLTRRRVMRRPIEAMYFD